MGSSVVWIVKPFPSVAAVGTCRSVDFVNEWCVKIEKTIFHATVQVALGAVSL